jgi:hypothetical protein
MQGPPPPSGRTGRAGPPCGPATWPQICSQTFTPPHPTIHSFTSAKHIESHGRKTVKGKGSYDPRLTSGLAWPGLARPGACKGMRATTCCALAARELNDSARHGFARLNAERLIPHRSCKTATQLLPTREPPPRLQPTLIHSMHVMHAAAVPNLTNCRPIRA